MAAATCKAVDSRLAFERLSSENLLCRQSTFSKLVLDRNTSDNFSIAQLFSTSNEVVDAVSSTFCALRDVAEAARFLVSSDVVEPFSVSTGSLFNDSLVDTLATSLLKKTFVRSVLFFEELSTEFARRISSNSVECRRSKVRSSDFVVLSSYFRFSYVGSLVVCCGDDEICAGGVNSAKVISLSTSGEFSSSSFGLMLRRRQMSVDSFSMAEFVDKI